MGNCVSRLFLDRILRWPDRIAARCQDQSLSYAELGRLAQGLGGLVRSLGAGPGASVLLASPDSFSLMAGMLGCILGGAVAAPINSRLPQDDYSVCIAGIRPSLVVAPPGHCALDAAREAGVAALALDDASLPGLAGNASPVPPFPAEDGDVALLLVTSGTTGHPKVVPHTQGHFFALAEHIGNFVGLRQDDVVLCSAKMSHAYGLFMSLVLPLEAGATVILDPDKPGAPRTLELLVREKVTVLASVPALYGLMLLTLQDGVRLDALRTCFSSGEALPEAVHAAWRDVTGQEFWSGYGTTEVMTFVIGSRPSETLPGKTGRVIPPYEAVVLDADGRPVPPGVPGHLGIRGPTVMTGYLNAPQWTRKAFTADGFYLTGDMAVEEGGVFTILGRMDDMFKAGGLWVSPVRVESALLSHQAVAQCAVTSGAAAGFSLVRAHVVLKEGRELDDALWAELRAHAAARLPEFMVPTDIVRLDALPMTASGKVKRYKLRQGA